ncbi:MAG: CDP-diacylglycerol--serine O-phosphatidyltransferase [Deltaproteobacteria bacterium]|nr:CDP-diacylglycerol--serine O-phosphatidyltransferase [Deltaproteobacteria bacterium]
MNDIRVKRVGIRKGIYILPNMITTASLFCGFVSIVHSIKGDHLTAAWMILLAGVFDGLDGRIARLTHTHSDFGIEYDSLCDLASFGLAPAILAYTWTLDHFHQLGWAAAFLFFACGAMRLARFNVQVSDVEKKHFQGLPIPIAAYVISSYVIFHYRWKGDVDVSSVLLLGLTLGLALLMVSNVKYRSFKKIDFKRKESFFALVFVACVLFVVVSAPNEMIFFTALAYVASGLVEEVFQLSKKARGDAPLLAGEANEHTPTPQELRLITNKK